MTRIIIFSDTHQHIDDCIYVLNTMPGVTAVIHAGDHDSDAEDLQAIFPEIPFYYVRGNCDYSSNPSERLVTIDDKRIFIAHGHTYGVKAGIERIKKAGVQNKADLVVYGHTHYPNTEYFMGMTLLNPGSVRYSGTYAVAEIEDGRLQTVVIDIPVRPLGSL